MQGLGGLILGVLKEDEVTRTSSSKEGLHCILGVAVMDAGLGLEGPALDLRVWTLVKCSPALGLPRAPLVQGTRAEQEFPVRGDSTGAALRCVPRLRARHLRRARAERNWEVEDSLA